MSISVNSSFKDVNNEIESLKTVKDISTDIKKRLSQSSNFDASSISGKSPLGIDAAKSLAKAEVTNLLDKLINTLSSSQTQGKASVSYLVRKFARSFKVILPQLDDIVLGCLIEAIGCDSESTYESNSSIYVRVQSIDLNNIFLIDPTTKEGKSMYEKASFNGASLTSPKRSTNKMLYECLQNENDPISTLYSSLYFGESGQALFDISYVKQRPSSINPATTEFGDFFKVTLKGRNPGPNKKVEFLSDYFKTIRLIDTNVFFTKMMDFQFDLTNSGRKWGEKVITDRTKFGRLVQRMLGECFDEDEEISVSGVAKTPELDDSSVRFFEFSASEEIEIAQLVSNSEKGVVVYDDCDNVELPVSSTTEYLYSIIGNIKEGSNILKEFEDNVVTNILNDKEWSLRFPYPQRIKRQLDLNFVKKFHLSLSYTILSPKVLLPLLVMFKAKNPKFDDSIFSFTEFFAKFRGVIRCIFSKVMAIFTKILFNEIKKDLKGLAKALLIDIFAEKGEIIYYVLVVLISIVQIARAIVRDFRRCKSIIDSLLSLLNLIKAKKQQLIPVPLLAFSELSPGFSPTRAFAEHIKNLNKMGVPTGPMPDGSPNLSIMKDFSLLKSQYKEQAVNGKIEGIWKVLQVPPTGMIPSPFVKVTGKSL